VPSLAISPRRGVVGTVAQVTLRGFSASEQIDVRFYKSGQSGTSVGVVGAGANGSGTTSFAIPATTYGSHEIRATGLSSGVAVRSTVIVTPSMKISPVESGAGSSVGVSLRGFAAGETVHFSLDGVDANVGEAVTSYSGSTSARYTRITIPAELAAGTYTVTAIGDESRSVVRTQIKVTVPEASEDPVPTPTVESTATATATATPDPTLVVEPSPTSTATATMTATLIPNASPIAIAPADVAATDSDHDGSELVVLDGTASYDVDGDAVTFAWTVIEHSPDGETVQILLASDAVAEITLPTGEHVITLTVTDTSGATGIDEVIVRIDPPEPLGGPGTPETVTNF
jgi:hypothetical protein